MTAPRIRLLLAEDNEADAVLELRELKRAGLRIVHRLVDTEESFTDALRDFSPDVILADFTMPSFDGMTALRIARETRPDTPFIFVSGTIGEEYAIRALKNGATDYVLKANLVRLPAAVERALAEAQTRRERRSVEMELAMARERIAAIVNSLPDMIWSVDVRSGAMIYASPAAAEIYGRSPDDFLATLGLWIDVVHPDDRPAVVTAWEHAQEGGLYDIEYRIVRTDGVVRWVHGRGTLSRAESGAPQRMDGLLRDITERIRLRDALLEREAGLRRAQSMAKLAHVVTAPDGSFESWSDTLPDLVGLDPARLPRATRAWIALLHPEDSALFRETAIEAARTGEHSQVEYRLQQPDGALIHIRQTMEPLSVPGAPGGSRWFNTLQDVTAEKHSQESLRASETRFRQIAENIREVFWLSDPAKNQFLYVSPAYETIWGRSCETLYSSSRDWIDAIHPEDRERVMEAAQTKQASGKYVEEYRIVRPDGVIRWIRDRAFPVFRGEHEVYRIAGLAEDITERKEAEQKIKRLNRVYAVLSGINTLIVRARDRNELFREACRIAVEQGGFQLAWIGVVDRSAMKIVPVAATGVDDGFLEQVRERLSLLDDAPAGHGPPAMAVREKRAFIVNDVDTDPRIRHRKAHALRGIRSLVSLPLMIAGEPIAVFGLHADEVGYFDEAEMKLLRELAGDIAFAIDHIDKQERLDYLAYYDVLTGLANRSLFVERVAQYMRREVSGDHKLAVVLIDLERFKNINDSMGQPAGDELLRQVATWLTRNVGDANLLARTGADHFALVLPEVKHEGDVARLLEKMMDAFRDHPFRLNDAVLRIAAKFGVALFPEDGGDAETIFKNAEAALKKAKANGDRYLFYAQKMTEMVAGRLKLETQLREALDNGEFVLHYQPKVNLATGTLCGAEALIRWNDPRTGLVLPGRFIPVLEETGLIDEVGRWALHKALEDYLRWCTEGLAAVRIAVNVSPLQLRSRNFVAEIEQAIAIDPRAARGLELEITESMIMEDVTHCIASLRAIRAMGVSITIDDFGTGFSSLSYLSKLPVDTLKIDRAFVLDMTVTPEGLSLVSTIINLAHSLELKVVAEGVETEEESHLLRLLNCDEMQGYLFSRPMPCEIFETKYLTSPSGL